MTELSFTEHAANQIANNSGVTVGNDTVVGYNDDSESYEEKHVTIDEELPVVYKPKSFSVPDLLDDTTYEGSKHQHPALKFSISSSNTTDTSAFLRKWFPKEKTTTCSPLAARRHRIKDTVPSTPSPPQTHKKKNNKDTSILSSLWSSKSELSRSRGKTHPQYTTSSSDDEQQQQEMVDSTKVLSTKRRSLSTNTYDPKWLSFWRKISIFKLNKSGNNTTTNNSSHNNKKTKKKKTSKSAEPSFDDLPPIRCTVSHSNLLRDNSSSGGCDETNNNSNCNNTNTQHSNSSREGEYLFSVSKSYKPTEQCCKNNTDDQLSSAVKLKRIRSLPIL